MKKRCSAIAMAIFVIFSSFSVAHANPTIEEITLPSKTQIEERKFLNRLYTIDSGGSDKALEYLNTLAPSDLLLFGAEFSSQLEIEGASIENIILLSSVDFTERVTKRLSDDQINEILDSPDFNYIFKIYFIDSLRNKAFMSSEMLSDDVNDRLVEFALDESINQDLSVHATLKISDATKATPVLIEKYENASSENDAMMYLRCLSMSNEEEAASYAQNILDTYEMTRAYEDPDTIALACKLVIRGTRENTNARGNDILMFCKNILETSNDMELKKGIIFALAEINSPDVIQIAFDSTDLTALSSSIYLLSAKSPEVMTFLETASVSEISECVQAAPLKDFAPVLQSRLNLKDSTLSENDMNEIQECVRYIETFDERSRALTSNFGRVVYRNGVGNDNIADFWHAGLINENPNTPITHIMGVGYVVKKSGTLQFINVPGSGTNNKLMGAYKHKNETPSLLNRVSSMGDNLALEKTPYTFDGQITISQKGIDQGPASEIWPDEIVAIRCDGIVEYCYEFYGARLLGTDGSLWNISIVMGAQSHALGSLNSPIKQSQVLKKFSSTFPQ